MRHACVKAVLGAAALGALLAGCATTVEMGPGYYHWDTRAVDLTRPADEVQPTVVVHEARQAVQPAPVVEASPAVPARPSVGLGSSAEVAPAPGSPAMPQ
jgi:hypothetical protein